LRRVWPGPVFLWTLVAAAALAQWPSHGALFPVALAISLYSVAVTLRRAEALAAAALAAGVVLLVVAQDGTRQWGLAVTDAAGFAGAVLLVGLYVGTRRAYLAELRDRARRLERERDASSALAAAEERARIAREMHDSVAHHLTVIVALSDGALRAVTRSPAEACDAIRDLSGTARQALSETRRVLGVLRTGVGEEPMRPQPGVAELDALVARVRSAGLPVRYECTGIAVELPTGVQLAVFRLVQEALTNTMKHAGPRASAAVRLQVSSGEVSVDIEDDGAGGMTSVGAAGGGLTGMRERIRAFGGDLDCGPRDPQGWRVSARIRPGATVS
jgi:signal transduction histidine kinase